MARSPAPVLVFTLLRQTNAGGCPSRWLILHSSYAVLSPPPHLPHTRPAAPGSSTELSPAQRLGKRGSQHAATRTINTSQAHSLTPRHRTNHSSVHYKRPFPLAATHPPILPSPVSCVLARGIPSRIPGPHARTSAPRRIANGLSVGCVGPDWWPCAVGRRSLVVDGRTRARSQGAGTGWGRGRDGAYTRLCNRS